MLNNKYFFISSSTKLNISHIIIKKKQNGTLKKSKAQYIYNHFLSNQKSEC